MILTALFAKVAAWSYNRPFIWQFRPETSYNYSGHKNEWPVYLFLRNVDLMIRSNPSNLASILVALLPVTPKFNYKGHGKNNGLDGTTNSQARGCKECLRVYYSSSCPAFRHGKAFACADGRMRQCYPVICPWMPEYFESIHLLSIEQPHCLAWEAAKSSFWDGNLSSWQLRDYWLCLQKMILTTQEDQTER